MRQVLRLLAVFTAFKPDLVAGSCLAETMTLVLLALPTPFASAQGDARTSTTPRR